jgi:hypothetical protein
LLGGCQYLGDGVAGKVGQLHSLQVGPPPLDRVQVGGVGGRAGTPPGASDAGW